jgi:Fur family iron response transcriptional regulator
LAETANRIAEPDTVAEASKVTDTTMITATTHDFEIEAQLRRVGLRPTRQRVALVRQAFGKGDRHFSAEALHAEALAAKIDISLATVYNTLHHFTDAGLLRVLSVEGAKTYFDTNTSDHHHFFVEGSNHIFDIDAPVTVDNLPEPPEGMEIAHVDVVIRLRPKA